MKKSILWLEDKVISSGKKLEVRQITFVYNNYDDKNKVKHEYCHVKNNNKEICIIPVLKPSNKLLLLAEFLPPIKKYSVTFPTASVFDEETDEDAVTRILKEKTGLSGRIELKSYPLENNGNTVDSLLKIITVTIPEDTVQQIADANNHDFKDFFTVNPHDFNKFIENKSENGYIINANVASFATGLLFYETFL